eukprot:RCo006664
MLRAGVLTVSDRCTAGTAVDKSGPAIVEMLRSQLKCTVERTATVSDDISEIQKVLISWCDKEALDLVLTTGGTGFAPRDVTPEATRPLLTKEAPGLMTAIMVSSLAITPMASLSRAVAGVRNQTLLVNLPGSVKGATECLSAILVPLPHALALLKSQPTSHQPPSSGSASVGTEEAVRPAFVGCSCCHGHEGARHSPFTASTVGEPISFAGVARRPRHSPYPMISVEAAAQLVEQHTPVLDVVRVPVTTSEGAAGQVAWGSIVASDVRAVEPHPPFRASVKDGYAVRAADGPGTFPVAQGNPSCLPPGHVIRVVTGGPVPEGADAVIDVEDTELVEADDERDLELQVTILRGCAAGKDIRPVGCDISVNELLLPKGASIGTAELGLLTAMGITSVDVYRLPVVGVLSTGSELVDSGSAPAGALPVGKIRDSNRPALLGLVRALGLPAVDMGIVRDSIDDLSGAVEQALGKVDVLVTSGGVSMGECDYIKAVVAKLGGVLHFGRVSVKPGKPSSFSTFPGRRAVLFGCPGNPVSAVTMFHVFVVPMLRKMQGMSSPALPRVQAKVLFQARLDPERPEFHRAVVRWSEADHGLVAESTGLQASSRLSSMRSANALLELPQGSGLLEHGALVSARLIGPLC